MLLLLLVVVSQGPSGGGAWDYELAENHGENAGLGRISLYGAID